MQKKVWDLWDLHFLLLILHIAKQAVDSLVSVIFSSLNFHTLNSPDLVLQQIETIIWYRSGSCLGQGGTTSLLFILLMREDVNDSPSSWNQFNELLLAELLERNVFANRARVTFVHSISCSISEEEYTSHYEPTLSSEWGDDGGVMPCWDGCHSADCMLRSTDNHIMVTKLGISSQTP